MQRWSERGCLRVCVCAFGQASLKVRRMIERAGLHNVSLLGDRPDAREVLVGADIFLNTSEWEGMPIAMLEAVAVGLPIVAPRMGSIPDVFRDGGGAMVDPAVSPADIAAVLRVFVTDGEGRVRTGGEARSTVAHRFSIHAVADQHLELYRELPAGRGACAG